MLVVTPVQSIAIFGYWDQPRRIVAWDDLVKGNWTWRRLRNELNFSPLELLKIQKDKTAWVTRGSLTLHDLPEMIIFPVNPFTDMQADLGEVWSMQWQPSLLHEMGVTYDQMKSRGLSAQIMSHFGFSLSSWFMLGFRIQHAETLSNDECNLVFGLEKPELEKIVREFSPTA